MSEISILVKKIIANELMNIPHKATDIKDEYNLKNDLATDSLDLVCIGMEIEKEFGIVINESEIDMIETVGELIEMVEKSVNKK